MAHTTINEIKTSFDFPPVPCRDNDWSAWFDGLEEWKVGRGPTEAAAILDLMDQVDQAAAPAEAN